MLFNQQDIMTFHLVRHFLYSPTQTLILQSYSMLFSLDSSTRTVRFLWSQIGFCSHFQVLPGLTDVLNLMKLNSWWYMGNFAVAGQNHLLKHVQIFYDLSGHSRGIGRPGGEETHRRDRVPGPVQHHHLGKAHGSQVQQKKNCVFISPPKVPEAFLQRSIPTLEQMNCLLDPRKHQHKINTFQGGM